MAVRKQRRTLQSIPEIRRFLLENVRPTGRTLGVGSYGSVDEVEVDGLICAGKKIHEMLINEGIQTIACKYVAECQLMSDMRHPHIVQFLGLCFLEDSSLPVLVMEKLMTSLDDLLENTPNISLGLKKSILADVARGLVYLHGCKPSPVIHRDLSAKNVLLNSALVAKVSDLGNSRIVGLQPGQLARTLSRAPGTGVYMPPEALDETIRTRYGPSLDIFSFGHLSLFTLTQVFPGDLRPHTYPDPHNRRRLIARSEVERRKPYFTHLYQQLGEKHPLVQLVERCLDNDPEYRPSAVDVLQQLEAVEVEDPYQHLTKLDMIRLLQQRADPQREEEIQRLQTQVQQMQLDVTESRAERDRIVGESDAQLQQLQLEVTEVVRVKNDVIHQLEVTVTEKDRAIQELERAKEGAVREKERAVQEKERAVREKERAVREKEVAIQRLQVTVTEKDRAIQETEREKEGAVQQKERAVWEKDEAVQKLQEKERVIQRKERAIRGNEQLIQTLLDEVQQKDDLHQRVPRPQGGEAAAKPPAGPKVTGLHKNTKLHFKQLKQLPRGMVDAQAVMYRGTLYVGGGSTTGDEFTLFMYQFKPNTWGTIKTPTRYYALAVYQDHLVLTGGHLPRSYTTTDQLWLTHNQRRHTFKQTIPPMNTPAFGAIAIATEEHLIIAGGYEQCPLTTVQVYSGTQWALAQPLPVAAVRINYTILNNTLYLIGGYKQDSKVFYTSLPALLGSVHQLKTTQGSTPTVWNTLTDVPLERSSIAIFRSELVAIGGGNYSSPRPSLRMCSRHTHRWEEMEATLPQPLHSTCSITLPTGELMVIGGARGLLHSAQVYTVSVNE